MLLKLLYHALVNKSRRSLVYHPQLVAVYHQHGVLYIIKPQERYSLKGADEIQGWLAALDDMHHASRGDDIPSLREPPKLAKLASGNPYCGLDKQKKELLIDKSSFFVGLGSGI